MHYTELAQQLKNKNPEYINRDDKELAESYLQRYPEEKGLIDFNKKETTFDIAKGVGQKAISGISAGQTPHFAGINNELANLPKKYKNISSINDIVKLYKDLGKDYVQGREALKQEEKEFSQNHPYLSFGSELLGGLVGFGKVGKGLKALNSAKSFLLNSPKFMNNPILKSALIGGGFSGAYGLSNTEGRALDLNNALKMAGVGTVGGAVLGGIGNAVRKTTQKLLGNKVVPQLEGKEIPQLTNAEKVLLKEGQIPKNVIDVTPSQEIKNNLLPKTEGIKDIVAKEQVATKNPFGTGYFMDGVDILVPEGMENKNFRAFLKSPLIQEEARKGLIGRKWETYQNQAADEFRKMNKEIKKVVDNAYKIIPDDTIIPMKKGEENLMYQLANELSALSNKTVIKKQTNAIKEASDLLGRIENASNNETSLTFGNVKDLTDELWSLSQKYEKRNNPHAADMFKKMYNHMRTFRDTNPEVKKATELYKDFKEINKTLGEIGFDVEKASNNNNIGTRIQVHGRGRKEEILNRALDKVAQILNRHSDNPELAQFQTLRDKVNLAQVSYDARPTDNSKLLNAFSFLRPIQTLRNISDRYTNPQAQEQLKVLAARIKTGKVNPKDFENIEILRGGDYANRNYYRKKAYGDVLETLKSNLLNKEVIEGGGK